MPVFKNFSIVFQILSFLPCLLLVRKMYVDIVSIFLLVMIWVLNILVFIVDDVVEFYKTPVDKIAPLDALNSMKLPENLHIQTEYHRFHPGNL